MQMEGQVVRRRVNIIASHLAAHEDISATATHLFPMSCSNSLNSAIQRRDSKMYFARQASSSQACFMRQTSGEQGKCAQSMPFKSTSCSNQQASEAPMFSRASRLEPRSQNFGEIQPLLNGSSYSQPVPHDPCFARPSRAYPQFHSKERNHALQSSGSQWSPRMDIVESGHSYVVIIELPGVAISSIKVEVSDQNLMVTYKRSIQRCLMASCSNNSVSAAYQKREISQGPYKIVWSLPANVNKDSLSAEFMDGLLQINMPKLSGVKQQMKALI